MGKTTELTAEQERFCQLIVQGTKQDAAVVESGVSKSKNPATNRMAGSRLAARPKIKLRIAEIRAMVLEHVVVDQAWVTNKLVENTLAAMSEGKRADANRGLELLGKTLSMFVDRKDIRVLAQFENLSDQQLIDRMKTITMELEADEAMEPEEDEEAA
jgi:phage terminase small subunit